MKNSIKYFLIGGSLMLLSSLRAQTYTLVWEDNFDGASLDSSIWNIEEKEGIWNTGSNSEFQHYKKENVTVGDDGDGNNCLILKAKEETYNDYSYTSGKVTTKGKLAFRRGKLEAYIKMPDLANGLWPAFWTLGYTTNGWPDCGEIDVLEMGHAQGIVDGTQNSFIGAHLFWYYNGQADYGNEMVTTEDLTTGYYKHTLIWDETTIKVYFNDAVDPYFSMGITGDDVEEFSDYQHYIILNLAVGGSVPAIYNKLDITAPLPASMYIDWVKIYQEEGEEDYNDTALAIFGDYGVYEETVSTSISMTKDFDLLETTSGVTERSGETPYEGDNALSYTITSGQDFEIKLSSVILRNMSNYDAGSLQFHIKSELTDAIQIGVADTTGNVKFITLSEGSDQNFTRDGTWQLVSLPLADVSADVDIDALEDLLIVRASPTANGYISIDLVLYKETLPDDAYYGIYWDNTAIVNGYVINNNTTNLFVWSNSITFNTVWPAFEGPEVLSFQSSGAQAWCGFGLHSSSPIDLQAFSEGYLNISMRTTASSDFYIGMGSQSGEDGRINFTNGSDPYGFVRDGEWQHLNIPISDLIEQGLVLSSLEYVFKTGSEGSMGDLAYDYIYLSEDLPSIDNPYECKVNSITITPRNTSVLVDELVSYSANVTNQFGNQYDNKVEWTSTGGTIRSDGLFDCNTVGAFVVTATQGIVKANTNVYVSEPSAISISESTALKAYFNKSLSVLSITGINMPSTCVVINTSGQVVYRNNTTEKELLIDLSGQSLGMYILQVTDTKNHYTYKFLK
jgi:beta-glucanase (GH16 family)